MLAAQLAVAAPVRFADAAPREGVLVFAAASLRNALDAAAKTYEQEAGERIVAAYASSSMLARQIGFGAPADLFISANLQWMDYLDERGLITRETRSDLFGNRLVLVAPRSSGVKVDVGPRLPLVRLLGGGRLAIGDPDHVPAGIYARAALRSLGLWRAVEGRLARAENVRAALALVAWGEVLLGIVYGSDASADPGVEVVGTFPQGTHSPIVYVAAVTAPALGAPRARRFLDYLESSAAAPIFERFGFTVLD